jgi:FAD/FMN-containing dehydrogenase
MNKIVSFDDISGIVTCQAGVILENLNNFLENKGYIAPLDLGAKGSCHIGGNVATNAGGVRLLRYGSLHGNVLGLEVVLADGTVIDNLTTLRKDNTGYDIKQLFIGSEGTLGVITAVSILTPPKPQSINVAFFGLNSFENVKQTYKMAKFYLGEIISAVEFLDHLSLEMVLKFLPNTRNPFNESYPFYMLIETSGSHQRHDEEKLNNFLEKILNEKTLVANGTIAQDITQIRSLWKLREGIPESLQKAGAVYKYDVSISLNNFYNLVEDMRNKIGNTGTVVGYGHIGDGNLHLNISTPIFDSKILNIIEPYVYEWIAKERGSISAEHGIGLAKTKYLSFSKSLLSIQIMKNIKNLLDPNGILNPYKVLPPI